MALIPAFLNMVSEVIKALQLKLALRSREIATACRSVLASFGFWHHTSCWVDRGQTPHEMPPVLISLKPRRAPSLTLGALGETLGSPPGSIFFLSPLADFGTDYHPPHHAHLVGQPRSHSTARGNWDLHVFALLYLNWLFSFQTDIVNTMCGYKTIDKEVK